MAREISFLVSGRQNKDKMADFKGNDIYAHSTTSILLVMLAV
jgi:hypothetical protein